MIIGLTGCKGAGKDTAAQFLVEERGFVRKGFADKLKEATAALFDIPIEVMVGMKDQRVTFEVRRLREDGDGTFAWKRLTWRQLHQRMGTEVGREVFGKNFWVDLALPQDEKPLKNTVFSDLRFANEALRIIGHKGYVIEILRPGHEPDGHASENPLADGLIDAHVLNDGDLEQFRRRFLATYDAVIKGVVNDAPRSLSR